MEPVIDKNLLLDSAGRPLTQSLFLEIGYSDYAIYSLKDEDFWYKGKLYPSIKRLYLESEDPTEYEFAIAHFLSWSHWLRLCENKAIMKHISAWREELEVKLRSQAIKSVRDQAYIGNSYQAAKFLADRGWEKRGAGRPTEEDKLKDKRIKERLDDEFGADIKRLSDFRK